MKCGYCSGDVAKDKAIKDGRYYHKDCYKKKKGKQDIEEYWLTNINSGTVIQLLRKVIKDISEIYDTDYILWVLKRCKENKINLQYPQGIKGCCDKKEFKDEWYDLKISLELKNIKSKFEEYINTEQSEIKYINRNKNFTKIL